MYQCDHSRSAKGNGLGLSIAKELVSIHKGTITAASVPGNGTTFISYFRKLCDPTELFLKKFYLGKVMARFAFYNWNHERRKPYDDYYN